MRIRSVDYPAAEIDSGGTGEDTELEPWARRNLMISDADQTLSLSSKTRFTEKYQLNTVRDPQGREDTQICLDPTLERLKPVVTLALLLSLCTLSSTSNDGQRWT